jgi:TolB-like protein/Flp pilus assembly protein TadD
MQVKRLLDSPRNAAPALEAGRPRPARRDEGVAAPAKTRMPTWAWAALSVVIVGAVTFFVSRQAEPPAAPPKTTAETKPAPQSTEKSIAVLAFVNFGGDKDNEYFSDGITEELLNVLAKVPGLRVAARTSAFYFKDKNVPIPEIASKLNVAYIVEGSVQKSGTRVKITAQLISAADGFHVWSDTFTRELKDVFAMQDEIAGLIAKQLQLTLSAAPRANHTVNPEANALVFEGRYFWNQRAERTEEVLARAADAFQRALAIAPAFAEAHAGLGDVWVARGSYRAMDGRSASAADDYAQAKTEAQRALELNPGLAEPHVTLGYVAYWQRHFSEAEQHYAWAFAANPNYALAYHWHSMLLTAVGRVDESLPELERSLRLDPLSANTLWSSTVINLHLGRLAEALAASDRTLELRPGLVPVHSDRALILLKLGRKDEAITEARTVGRDLSVEPRWWADADAIYVLRAAGRQEEADEHARRALAAFSTDDYRRAFVLAALGRFEEALSGMGTTPTTAFSRVYWHPMWDPCRNDPRFQQLLVKLGCAEEYKVARETLARMRREQPETK